MTVTTSAPTSVDVLRDAVAKGTPITRINPLQVAFKVLSDPATALEAAVAQVEVSLEVNPLLAAALEVGGATRTGRRSWSFDPDDTRQMQVVMETVYEGLWHSTKLLDDVLPGKPITFSHRDVTDRVSRMLDIDPRYYYKKFPHLCERPNGHPWSNVVFGLSTVKRRLHFKVVTDLLTVNGVNLNLFPNGGVKDAIRLTARDALALRSECQRLGYLVVDRSAGDVDLTKAGDMLATSVVALSHPGSFGEVELVIGALTPGATGFRSSDSRIVRSEIRNLSEAQARLKRFADAGADLDADPIVTELLKMEGATPKGRTGLRGYQDLCVSLMRASERGVLNAVAPGLGKTVITAVGLKEEAADAEGVHASLIVVPAGMRSQWKAELAEWHADADVRTIESSRDVEKALEDLREGAKSRIVVASYEMAVSAEEELSKHEWDAMVVDEAAIFKSAASKRTQALWRLRTKANKAFALTGTPIDKSVDDLGRIVGWVRQDEVFSAEKLSKRHPRLEREVQREALRHTLGPVVFRRDRSEIADELPMISTEVVRIDPSPAEKALAVAARKELETIYEGLLEKIAAAEALDPTDKRFKAARDELQAARGAVLGGVTLARMAATDPQAVMDSDSAGALLLKSTGLVAKACKAGGTKRKQLVELTTDLVGRGEKVLLFTDFSSVAENLAKDLAAAGVRTGTIMGGQSHKSRHEAATSFMDGDLDALVLTAAAQEGLNLQAASVLVHVDLPWMPSAIVQRVGRASRIGSHAKHLSVLIPLMAGTVEERVAAVLVPRAMVAMSALDSGRVEDVRTTELGMALSGLADIATDAEADKANLGLLEMAREILKA